MVAAQDALLLTMRQFTCWPSRARQRFVHPGAVVKSSFANAARRLRLAALIFALPASRWASSRSCALASARVAQYFRSVYCSPLHPACAGMNRRYAINQRYRARGPRRRGDCPSFPCEQRYMRVAGSPFVSFIRRFPLGQLSGFVGGYGFGGWRKRPQPAPTATRGAYCVLHLMIACGRRRAP